MSNKKIEIDPMLFSIGGFSKTKKNKEKKSRPTVRPLISPNVLKNKLLKRIKEHKKKEQSESLDKTTNNFLNTRVNIVNTIEDKVDITKYTDEFNDSINYLQSLSKQKQENEEKLNYQYFQEKRKDELQKRTLKNFDNNKSLPFVFNELPNDLKEPLIKMDSQDFTSINEKPLLLSQKSNLQDLPYGILKGGTKPTYREWNKTQKNLFVNNPNSALIIENKQTIDSTTERERKLAALKQKLRSKQKFENAKTLGTQEVREPTINLNENIEIKTIQSENTQPINTQPINTQLINTPLINNEELFHNVNELNIPATLPLNMNSEINMNNYESAPFKRIYKKTIRKKYTLGKSELKQTVGVLLKDRKTRKLILNAQKNLKDKCINDVKTYLKQHNLIKFDSNAPNDVLRKLYESAMLTGEITNNNKETLIHNFIKSDSTN
jgi:hypothetical protein